MHTALKFLIKFLKQHLIPSFTNLLLVLIILVGIIGNIVNMIVCTKKNMRRISLYRLLIYLSIADLLVIIVCAGDSVLSYRFQMEIRTYSVIVCRIHTFFTYFLSHLSSVLSVIASVCRYMIMKRQHLVIKSRQTKNVMKDLSPINESQKSCQFLACTQAFMQTLSDAIIVDLNISIIVFLLLIANIHFISYFEVEITLNMNKINNFLNQSHFLSENKLTYLFLNNSKLHDESYFYDYSYLCFPLVGSKYYKFLNHYFFWVDMSIYFFIPFIIRAIFSFIIPKEICHSNSMYMKLLVKKPSISNRNIFSKRIKRNRALLIRLIIPNVYFLVTMCPYFISLLLIKIKSIETPTYLPFLHFMIYSNNVLNFVFYGVSSKKFRIELAKLCFNKETARLRRFKQNKHITKQKSKQSDEKEINIRLV